MEFCSQVRNVAANMCRLPTVYVSFATCFNRHAMLFIVGALAECGCMHRVCVMKVTNGSEHGAQTHSCFLVTSTHNHAILLWTPSAFLHHVSDGELMSFDFFLVTIWNEMVFLS